VGLASGEPTEHVCDGYPHVWDAGAAATLVVVHGKKFSIVPGSAQQGFAPRPATYN
jgi:hypothetical protein